MSDLFEEFIKSGLYVRGWSVRTPDVYRRAFSSFQQSQREVDVAFVENALTRAQLEAWIVWMRERGLSPSCINIYIRSLNSFLTWLAEQGHLTTPLRLKQVKAHLKRIQGLSDAEITGVLALKPQNWNDRRSWTLVSILLATGCRIDEILNLRLADCDFDNLLVTVKGKGGKFRRGPYQPGAPQDAVVGSQKDGTPLSQNLSPLDPPGLSARSGCPNSPSSV